MKPRPFFIWPRIRVAYYPVYGRAWSVRWGRKLFHPRSILGIRP